MNTIKFAKKLAVPLFVALAYGPSQGLAQSILGASLDDYAVFGKTNVTSAPLNASAIAVSSTIGGGGDVGSLVGVTGNYNLSVGSLIRLPADSAAGGDDLGPVAGTAGVGSLPGTTTAMGTLGLSTVLAGVQNIDGTYAPGTYDFYAGLLNTAVVLDGNNDPNAVWIFRFGTTLTAATGSTVTVEDVGTGSGVGIYWSTGTQAILNGNTFAGNVLAQTIISSDGDSDGMGFDTALNIGCGRLLSATQVTLIGDSISIGCGKLGDVGFGSNGYDQGNMVPVPEPETYAMLLAGLGLMGFVARRRQRNLAAAA